MIILQAEAFVEFWIVMSSPSHLCHAAPREFRRAPGASPSEESMGDVTIQDGPPRYKLVYKPL